MLDALRSNTLRSAEIISAPYQQGLVNAVEDDYNEFGIVQPEWALPKTNDEGNITMIWIINRGLEKRFQMYWIYYLATEVSPKD